nr:zinc ribbon domain-containing protein [Fundicoccus ignavus]
MLEYQASQKNVAVGNRKYLNRYPFSGKIECAECGDTFKRRIHTSTHRKYIAWCCSTHIKNKYECSMLFIREERIHQAFITMINKLIFARKKILHSLFETVKNGFKQDTEEELDNIELQLTECYAKSQMLKKLMDDKFLERKLYEEQQAKMDRQINELFEDKQRLLRLIRNEEEQIYELKRLISFTNKQQEVVSFEETIFNEYINKICIYSPTRIGFLLKSGLLLKEEVSR